MCLNGWCLWCLVLVQCAGQFHCIEVTFRSNQPLKVALKQTLVLEASVSEGTANEGDWDIKREDGHYRLSPGADPRISTELKGNELKLTVKDIRKEDFGTYIIRVTDKDGKQASAMQIVEKSEEAPAVSIRLLCEVSHNPNYEQWDVPKFEWLVDSNKVLNTSGELSPDGRTLNIIDTSGYNYTCRVSSSLGTRDTHFSAGCKESISKQTDCNSCTAERVIMSLALLGCLALAITLFYREKSRMCQGTTTAANDPANRQEGLALRNPPERE